MRSFNFQLSTFPPGLIMTQASLVVRVVTDLNNLEESNLLHFGAVNGPVNKFTGPQPIGEKPIYSVKEDGSIQWTNTVRDPNPTQCYPFWAQLSFINNYCSAGFTLYGQNPKELAFKGKHHPRWGEKHGRHCYN